MVLLRHVSRASTATALALALAGHGRSASAAEAPSFVVVTPQSSIVVDVHKSGVLSPWLHDHHFRFDQVSGAFTFDPRQPHAVRGEILVDARVLTDEQPELSREDRLEVERQVRSDEVLDAARFPTIRFVVSGMEVLEQSARGTSGTIRGTLLGTLELHGRMQPIRVPVAASYGPGVLRATGATAFEQSAFGIEPYSKAFGSIGVEDRVDLRFDLTGR